MAFKWSREQMEKLIACIEKLPCLYDVKSKEYENRTLKTQAYNTIVKEMQRVKSSITLGEIKRKWKSLRTMYCQEIRKIKQSQRSGPENAEEYVPKLWCFQQLNYLRKHTEGRKTTGKFKILKHDHNDSTLIDNQNDCSNEEPPKRIRKRRNLNLEERVDNVKTLLTARLMEKKDYDWLGKQVVFELNCLKDESLQRETAWKIQQILREAYLNDSATSSQHCSTVYQYQ